MRPRGFDRVMVAVVLTVAPMPTARAEDAGLPALRAFEHSWADDVDSFGELVAGTRLGRTTRLTWWLVPPRETHNSGCGVAAADPRDGAEDASPCLLLPAR